MADDWDLMFLQAAGKSNNLKRKPETKENSDVIRDYSDDAAIGSIVNSKNLGQQLQVKKAKKTFMQGTASNNLCYAGFRFADTADFKSKYSFAASYQMIDSWKEQGKIISPTQNVIRTMFILVRNSRAIGFGSYKKSITPIRHSYRKKKSLVYTWLTEMRILANTCPEVVLTKQYIQDSVDAIVSISKEVGESDCEDENDDDGTQEKVSKNRLKINEKRRNQTQNCRISCLKLISALDSVYGELLVAALDNGTSLPDPRLYLESLSGISTVFFI